MSQRRHSPPSSVSVESLRRIESVCSRFELATSEQQSRIEDFLDRSEGDERALLLAELIALDVELRRERGDSPADRDYERLWDSIGRHAGTDGGVDRQRDSWRAMLSPSPDEPSPIPISERYRFLERIGRGGIGDVWKVHDNHGERTVAVKLLRDQYRGDTAASRRFDREAKLTGTLQHPGIPPVYDHGRLGDGAIYFSMRLVEGETLASLLQRRPAVDRDVTGLLGIFEQVAQALAYAHTERVVHRDLKPANVMVGRFGEVQVMDWGLAKRLDSIEPDEQADSQNPTERDHEPTSRYLLDVDAANDSGLTRAGDIVGTPHCMSPEQARGDLRQVDERADVFGLGAILLEILTRRRLCEGLDTNQAVRKLAEGDLSDSLETVHGSGHDPELIRLCEHCLQPSPDDRPSNADEVATRVSDYLAGVARRLRDAEIDRSAALVRAAEERKRRKVVVQLASAVAIISVIGVAGVAWQWNEAAESSRNAIAARRLADERFHQAQQVVQEYLTEVAKRDGVLARTPGTQTLRRALLEKARDYYDQFLNEASGDPSLRFETAAAYARLGEIMHILDPGGEDVFALYGNAIQIYQQLSEVTKGDDAIRAAEGLADAHAAIGNAHLSGNAHEQAEAAYAAATQVLTDLIVEHGRQKDQLSLAKMTHNIALTRANRGQKREAEKLFLDAVRLAEPLLETLSDDPESLDAIANVYSGIGVHYGFKLGDWKASLDYGQKAVELRSRLVELAPGRHRYENALAGSYNNVALALYHNARPDDAHDSFLLAAEVRERLTRENPAIPEYAWLLGNIYNNLGTMSVKRDGGRDSVHYYEKALALKRRVFLNHPQVLKYGDDTIDLLTSLASIDPRHPRTAGLIREVIELYDVMRMQQPDSRAYATNLALFRLLALTTAEPFSILFAETRSADSPPPDEDEGISQLLELTADCGPDRSGVSPRHRTIRCLALARAGRWDAAAAAVDAIPADDRDPLSWLAACQVHVAMGDFESARESLRLAAERIDKKPFPEFEWMVLRAEAEQALESGDALESGEAG